MSTERYDDLTQAFIAQRIVEAYPANAGEMTETSEADERRLDSLMQRYAESDPPEGAVVTPIQVRSTRTWPIWTGLGLAAAVVLAVALRGLLGPAPLGTRYELDVQRELALVRGSDEQGPLLVFREDRTLEVWLRPIDAVDPPLAAAVYARREGEVRHLSVSPTMASNGVVHIVATIHELGLPLGEWELVFIVGRTNELPELDELPDAVDGTTQPYDVRTVVVRIIPVQEPTEPR